jgi:hypothetical protein
LPAPAVKEKPKSPPPAPPVPLDRYVEVGDFVQWFPSADRSERPQPAICSAVRPEDITATVFSPVWRDVCPQEPCRHVDDPKAKSDGNSGGGWRHKPFTVAVRRMMVEMGVLKWNGVTSTYDVVEHPPEVKAADSPKS